MEYNNELYHHGIKGMRWGVRRYQNKDGSLTPAGQKRRAKLEGELEKLGGQKKTDDNAATRKKSISEMSNKELQEYTTRMQLEKNYYDAQRNLAASLPPKKVSMGEQLAKKAMNEVIMPAAMNAGKAYLDKAFKKAIGGDSEDAMGALKKIKDKLQLEQDIDKLRNPDKYISYEEKTKKYKLEKDMAADAEAKAKAEKEAASKTESQSKTDNSDNSSKSDNGSKSSNESSSSKVYEGTVEGVGASSKKNSDSKQSSKNDTVIDAEWYDVEVSNVPATVTNRGQSYIAGLLEPPKERDD